MVIYFLPFCVAAITVGVGMILYKLWGFLIEDWKRK
jgi:hypothetical protein